GSTPLCSAACCDNAPLAAAMRARIPRTASPSSNLRSTGLSDGSLAGFVPTLVSDRRPAWMRLDVGGHRIIRSVLNVLRGARDEPLAFHPGPRPHRQPVLRLLVGHGRRQPGALLRS